VSAGHVSDQLLVVFAEGDISSELGVQIALHLDECSRCHARARELDPLTAHFATVDDAPVPDELFAAISSSQGSGPNDFVVPGIAILALAAVLAFVVNGNVTVTHLILVLFAGSKALVTWFAHTNQLASLFFSLCFFGFAVLVSHIKQSRTLSSW
jgi:anti-sigma factor RsiW